MAAADDRFGVSVSLDGDTVVIGAAQHDDNGNDSGSAYVFVRNATVWTEEAKLLASDGAANDEFGFSVSLDGDTVVIGAFGDDDSGPDFGSAYVFSPVSVMIDIKPDVISPRARGGIWVAILSDINPESLFDPTSQVDIPTVQFGPDGAGAIRHEVEDVNKDGIVDLLLRFKIPETGIACGDTEATLTGETFAGESFMGTDAIKTVGCQASPT